MVFHHSGNKGKTEIHLIQSRFQTRPTETNTLSDISQNGPIPKHTNVRTRRFVISLALVTHTSQSKVKMQIRVLPGHPIQQVGCHTIYLWHRRLSDNITTVLASNLATLGLIKSQF